MRIRSALAIASLTAALLAVSCGGGNNSMSGGPTAPNTKTVVVTIGDDSFSPKNVMVNPGDTVRWVMMGSVPTHTVTAGDGSFDSGQIFTSQGAIFEHTFNASNTTVNYFCKTHQVCCGMQGAVQVGASAPDPKPGY